MESDQRVLKYAPLAGYDDSFSTPAMRQFDYVRSVGMVTLYFVIAFRSKL